MASLRASASPARPMPVTVAVILSALIIVVNFASPALPSGSGDDTVPTSVIVVGIILGLLGIPAAVGLWMLRKWGFIATLVVTAVNLLLAAPGIAFGPGTWIKIFSAVFTLASIAVIVLVTQPEARRAYA